MSFVIDYLIKPILSGEGYNLYNTSFLALILILWIFLTFKILKKSEIKLDKKLWLKLLPFALLGGITRALQDIDFFSSLGNWQYLFVTPGIYFLLYFITLSFLLFDKKLKKQFTNKIGWILVFIFSSIILINAKNWSGFATVIGFTLICFGITFYLFRKKLNNFMSYAPVFAHILDACSSVTAILIVGGFKEQHVLPNLLLPGDLFWFFIPLKIMISLFAVYLINKETNKDWRWLFLFTVFIMGIGPGVRNSLTLLLY